jgi:hypothetical protein
MELIPTINSVTVVEDKMKLDRIISIAKSAINGDSVETVLKKEMLLMVATLKNVLNATKKL